MEQKRIELTQLVEKLAWKVIYEDKLEDLNRHIATLREQMKANNEIINLENYAKLPPDVKNSVSELAERTKSYLADAEQRKKELEAKIDQLKR